jgi:hypothetical protein
MHRSSHIGDHGVALIHTRVSEMGLVWHERCIGAGIDGVIELRDRATREVANRSMLVQSKSEQGAISRRERRTLPLPLRRTRP